MSIKNKKTILLVEDEAIIGMMEKKQLEDRGYIVHHVVTGEDSVKTILDEILPIDLILMDIDLGSGIDGTQAAAQILNNKDIPIVFLSSHTEPEIVEKTEKITSYGYVIKNSGIVVLDASIKMAVKLFESKIERMQAEEEVAAFREFMDSVAGFGFTKDINLIYVNANRTFCDLLQIPYDKINGMTDYDIFPADLAEKYIADDKRVMETGKPIIVEEVTFNANTKQRFIVQTHKFPRFDKNGDVIGLYGMGYDVTELKKAEYALRESEERFRFLVNYSYDLIWILKSNGILSYVSPSWKAVLGYEASYMVDKAFQPFVHPGDVSKFENYMLKVLNARKPLPGPQYRVKHSDKSWRWHEGNITPVFNDDNSFKYFVGVSRDITEQKIAEENLQEQLAEKEILLQEIHHRVKNNIANIEGLLSLQADSTANPEVKNAMHDAVSRVQSMRILYDKLLLSNDYHDISIKSYTESIVDSLLEIHTANNNISIKKEIAAFKIISKKAVSVGIIINELLNNVFKHAFTGRDSGIVSITIKKTENIVTLIIQDNGIGIDENAELNKSSGFGLTIVKMLIDQLNGTFNMTHENGIKSVIQFEI